MNIKEQFTTVTPFSKFLALILFILLPIGGFWLGVEYGECVEIVGESAPVETLGLGGEYSIGQDVQDSVHKDITWEKYSSDIMGFQIVYPKNWFVIEEDKSIIFSNIESQVEFQNMNLEEFSYFSVSIRETNNTLSIDDWFKLNLEFLSRDYELMEINGIPTIKSIPSEGIGSRLYYYIASGSNVVEVLFGTDLEQYLGIYEKMLESVEFKNDLPIAVIMKETNAWINAMPGSGGHHVVVKTDFINNTEIKIKNVHMYDAELIFSNGERRDISPSFFVSKLCDDKVVDWRFVDKIDLEPGCSLSADLRSGADLVEGNKVQLKFNLISDNYISQEYISPLSDTIGMAF